MSMMFPAPKKQIVYDQPHAGRGQSKDRISELPDEVLISILSCLSIQEAGRTSILSHRWKNVWKLMIDWTLSLEGILISHQLAIGDRISELPDEVLISILSGLSIREAARTSVLSHRWRNVWKLMMHWSLALQGTGRE